MGKQTGVGIVNCIAMLFAWLLMSARLNVNAADNNLAHAKDYGSKDSSRPVTKACLYCICEALTACNATAVCVNGACGIFRIIWEQWLDSGSPTLSPDTSLNRNAFTNCVNDPHCAAETMQAYMVKYGQDCNDDGQIDCYDYGAVHYLGPFNCKADVPYAFGKLFNECLEKYEEQADQGAKTLTR